MRGLDPSPIAAELRAGKAIIDIDLDGVCADYVGGLWAHVASHYGLDSSAIPPPDNYNLARATGWPFSSTGEFLDQHAEAVRQGLYAKLPILEGVSEGFTFLKEQGFALRIVTHRLFIPGLHETVLQDTSRWLEQHKLPYDSICFLGNKDSLRATLHIDGSPKVIRSHQRAGSQVVVVDHLYNRHLQSLPRADGWRGIRQLIGQALAYRHEGRP